MDKEYRIINLPDFQPVPFSKKILRSMRRGMKNASNYNPEKLIEMIQNRNILDIYEAMGAIRKLKFKKALEYLMELALYDEDTAIQEEAIITIRTIGGREALSIPRYLKTTVHKEMIETLLRKNWKYYLDK